MKETENPVEIEAQELATVSGGATTRRTVEPVRLDISGAASKLSRADLTRAVQNFQLQPVSLPDFAVLMQLEYK